MAIYYTDFLNGNDTTGSGDFVNPFKSIYQASQALTANGDEIRVMGTTSTVLPGTLTYTRNGTSIATSQDLTSYFPDNFGYIRIIVPGKDDVFAYVHGITATTIKLNIYYKFPLESGTFTTELITPTYFAGVGVTPVSPSGTTGYLDEVHANAASYDNIRISGGWDTATTQGGYTTFITVGNNYYNRYGTAAIKLNTGYRNENLDFADFNVVNSNGFIKDSTVSYAMSGRFNFVGVVAGAFGTSNHGISRNINGDVPTWYSHYSKIGELSYNGTTAPLVGATNKLYVDVIIDVSNTTYDSIPGSYESLNQTSNPVDFNTKIRNLKIRSVSSSLAANIGGTGSYGYYIDSVDLSQGVQGSSTILFYIAFSKYAVYVGSHVVTTIAKLTVSGGSPYYPGNGTAVMGDGTQDVFEFGYTESSSLFVDLIDARNTTVVGYPPAIAQTSDGIYYSYNDGSDNLLFRPSNDFVTGTNALETAITEGGTNKTFMVGQFPKWNSGARTLTLKAKSILGATNYELIYQWGNINEAQKQSQAITLTSSYADYTMTIDPSTLADWSDNPYGFIRVYLRSKSGADNKKVLVDSVSIA